MSTGPTRARPGSSAPTALAPVSVGGSVFARGTARPAGTALAPGSTVPALTAIASVLSNQFALEEGDGALPGIDGNGASTSESSPARLSRQSATATTAPSCRLL